MQSTLRNYQYLGLIIIIWGSSFAMMHECLVGGHFTPEQTVGYRLAIGSLVLLIAWQEKRQQKKKGGGIHLQSTAYSFRR